MEYKEFNSLLAAHVALAAMPEAGTVYRIWDDGSSIYAVVTGDIDDACTEWCEAGDWSEGGKAIITVRYQSVGIDPDGDDMDGDERGSVDVEVGDDPDAIGECGTDDDDHDWQAPEFLGGCRENPGVWCKGGTIMEFLTVCSKCGTYRHQTDYGVQRNPGQADEVSYREADERSLAWVAEQE
jgi:hypothetical protein